MDTNKNIIQVLPESVAFLPSKSPLSQRTSRETSKLAPAILTQPIQHRQPKVKKTVGEIFFKLALNALGQWSCYCQTRTAYFTRIT